MSSPRATRCTLTPRSRPGPRPPKKAKSTDPKQVADALKTVGPWDTVLGPLAFDAKGDITKAEYVWSIWHNGAYSERWPARPSPSP